MTTGQISEHFGYHRQPLEFIISSSSLSSSTLSESIIPVSSWFCSGRRELLLRNFFQSNFSYTFFWMCVYCSIQRLYVDWMHALCDWSQTMQEEFLHPCKWGFLFVPVWMINFCVYFMCVIICLMWSFRYQISTLLKLILEQIWHLAPERSLILVNIMSNHSISSNVTKLFSAVYVDNNLKHLPTANYTDSKYAFVAAWWQQHGINCLELQRIAVRILSQTCSSFGCEHNWSLYDQIHSQRHNRVAQKRLNDVTYVHYNLRLRDRQIRKMSYDPIFLDSVLQENLLYDWIVESEKPVLQDDEVLIKQLSALKCSIDDSSRTICFIDNSALPLR